MPKSETASVPLCAKEMHVVREEVVSSGNARCYARVFSN